MSFTSTIFDLTTGEILSVLNGERPIAPEMPANSSWIDGSGNWATEYVSGGVFTARPDFAFTVSGLTVSVNASITISSIPLGTTVTYPGGEVLINDSGDTSFVISFQYPGRYELSFSNFPYKSETLIANCIV